MSHIPNPKITQISGAVTEENYETIVSSPLTTKGDILTNDGTNNVRKAVGTNNQVLIADSTQSSGVKWGTVTSASVSLAHTDLSGVTSDQHHAKSHAHDGVDGSGTVAHSDTTGIGTDDHHAKLHATDHSDGGVDEVVIENLAATSTDTTKFFQPDGAGGVQVATPVAAEATFSRNFLTMGA